MNDIPKPWQIEYYKKTYLPGTRIELISDMTGEDIPAGTKGTVVAVDDIGSIHMAWENGRSIALIHGEDGFHKIADAPESSRPIKPKKKDHGRDR